MPMVGGLRDYREHWAADDGELIVWFEDDGRAFQLRVFEPWPNQCS